MADLQNLVLCRSQHAHSTPSIFDKNDERLKNITQLLLVKIEGRLPTTSERMPVCFVGPLNDALAELNLGKTEAADLNLAAAIAKIEDQKSICDRQKAQFDSQLSASHLLRGVILSARCSMSENKRLGALQAEKHFDVALSLNPDDPQILFYRAMNSTYLGNKAAALSDYTRVITSQRLSASGLLVRAYFGAAQLSIDLNKPGNARKYAIDGIDALPKHLTETEEAGQMHKFLGEVRELFGSWSSAIESTSAALRIFDALNTPNSSQLAAEARGTLSRLYAQQVVSTTRDSDAAIDGTLTEKQTSNSPDNPGRSA